MTVYINGVVTPKVIWIDATGSVKALYNQTTDVTWADDSVTSETSPNAKFAIFRLRLKADTVGSGDFCSLAVRKNGETPTHMPKLVIDKAVTVAVDHYQVVIVGLDTDQMYEYELLVGTGWQVDAFIEILGYI